MKERRPRFQFVWWGVWRRASWWPLITWHPFKSPCWYGIYRWSVCIGPIEIRRWNWRKGVDRGLR